MKNLSSLFERASDLRVKRFILADIACPYFKASLILALYSRGKDDVCWLRNLNMLLPTKS